MTFLKFCGVTIAALAVAALWGVGAAANYAHALHKAGTSPWAPILAGASVMADVLKVVAALAVGYALRRRQWIGTGAALVIWACAAGWAAQSALGFVSVTFADSSAKRGTVASGETSVAAQLKAEVARLAWLNGQITDARGKDLERFNAEVNRTRASLDQLRQQNAAATGVSSADPAADFLAKHFGIANATTDLVIVLWFLALVEIVGNLGPSMVRGLMARDPDPALVVLTGAAAPLPLPLPELESSAPTVVSSTALLSTLPGEAPANSLSPVGLKGSGSPVKSAGTVLPFHRKNPTALGLNGSGGKSQGRSGGTVGALALQSEPEPADDPSVDPEPCCPTVDLVLIETKSSVQPGSVADFAASRIERRHGNIVTASELFGTYVEWCGLHGSAPVTQTMFGRELRSLGFEKLRNSTTGLIEYSGVRLAACAEAAA
jgi:hypothetical protein